MCFFFLVRDVIFSKTSACIQHVHGHVFTKCHLNLRSLSETYAQSVVKRMVKNAKLLVHF